MLMINNISISHYSKLCTDNHVTALNSVKSDNIWDIVQYGHDYGGSLTENLKRTNQ